MWSQTTNCTARQRKYKNRERTTTTGGRRYTQTIRQCLDIAGASVYSSTRWCVHEPGILSYYVVLGNICTRTRSIYLVRYDNTGTKRKNERVMHGRASTMLNAELNWILLRSTRDMNSGEYEGRGESESLSLDCWLTEKSFWPIHAVYRHP